MNIYLLLFISFLRIVSSWYGCLTPGSNALEFEPQFSQSTCRQPRAKCPIAYLLINDIHLKQLNITVRIKRAYNLIININLINFFCPSAAV